MGGNQQCNERMEKVLWCRTEATPKQSNWNVKQRRKGKSHYCCLVPNVLFKCQFAYFFKRANVNGVGWWRIHSIFRFITIYSLILLSLTNWLKKYFAVLCLLLVGLRSADYPLLFAISFLLIFTSLRDLMRRKGDVSNWSVCNFWAVKMFMSALHTICVLFLWTDALVSVGRICFACVKRRALQSWLTEALRLCVCFLSLSVCPTGPSWRCEITAAAYLSARYSFPLPPPLLRAFPSVYPSLPPPPPASWHVCPEGSGHGNISYLLPTGIRGSASALRGGFGAPMVEPTCRPSRLHSDWPGICWTLSLVSLPTTTLPWQQQRQERPRWDVTGSRGTASWSSCWPAAGAGCWRTASVRRRPRSTPTPSASMATSSWAACSPCIRGASAAWHAANWKRRRASTGWRPCCLPSI